ncbi:MAG TPA: extracellular solute-binding protein [Anaerolineales bacterium]|nr:extracellular solute-binding protein [Anaerolineales bacterium]
MTDKINIRTISRRDFLKLGATGMAAFVIARCAPAPAAPAESSGETGAQPAQEAVTLEFLAWGDPADIEAWDKFKNMYQERNPNVTVNVTTVADPAANFYPKLQTMLAGGTPPNVSSFQGWEWQTYADKDVLVPIDDYVAANEYYQKLFAADIQSLGQSTKRGDSLYLVPLQLATMVMFYVKKHFDDAGLPYPTDDWTYDEFMEMAKTLTTSTGDTKTFGLQANGSWFRDIHWIRSTGAQEFDELIDPKKAQFNQPGIVDILQTMAYDVYHESKISPTTADMEAGSNTIETGNVAMKYEGAWFLGRLNSPDLREQGKQLEFDVVMMPKQSDDARPHRGWAEGVVLPKSDNQDAAWDFVAFMAGEEGDKIYSETTGRLPNTLELLENFWIPTIKERFQVENGQAFVEGLKRSEVDVISGIPRSKMWNEIVKPIGYDPMLGGSASAAEVLPNVDAELQKMLDEYWANI